jgi:hypothetical protein
MPTDTFAVEHGDSEPAKAAVFSVDDLTFATPDLGREATASPHGADDDLDFALAPRLFEERPAHRDRGATPAPAPAPRPLSPDAAPGSRPIDTFVIREAHSGVPATPVDALVVGAPRTALDAAALEPAPIAFRVSSSTGRLAARESEEPPWTVRDAKPPKDTAPSPRGWATRAISAGADRSAHLVLLRLREEAVHVSWTSAWIAVNAADPGLSRKPAA